MLKFEFESRAEAALPSLDNFVDNFPESLLPAEAVSLAPPVPDFKYPVPDFGELLFNDKARTARSISGDELASRKNQIQGVANASEGPRNTSAVFMPVT